MYISYHYSSKFKGIPFNRQRKGYILVEAQFRSHWMSCFPVFHDPRVFLDPLLRSTSDLAMAITRDVPELVEHGFMGVAWISNWDAHGSVTPLFQDFSKFST